MWPLPCFTGYFSCRDCSFSTSGCAWLQFRCLDLLLDVLCRFHQLIRFLGGLLIPPLFDVFLFCRCGIKEIYRHRFSSIVSHNNGIEFICVFDAPSTKIWFDSYHPSSSSSSSSPWNVHSLFHILKIWFASSSATSTHPFNVISSARSSYGSISKRLLTHGPWWNGISTWSGVWTTWPCDAQHQSLCKTWNTPLPEIILVL